MFLCQYDLNQTNFVPEMFILKLDDGRQEGFSVVYLPQLEQFSTTKTYICTSHKNIYFNHRVLLNTAKQLT